MFIVCIIISLYRLLHFHTSSVNNVEKIYLNLTDLAKAILSTRYDETLKTKCRLQHTDKKKIYIYQISLNTTYRIKPNLWKLLGK